MFGGRIEHCCVLSRNANEFAFSSNLSYPVLICRVQQFLNAAPQFILKVPFWMRRIFGPPGRRQPKKVGSSYVLYAVQRQRESKTAAKVPVCLWRRFAMQTKRVLPVDARTHVAIATAPHDRYYLRNQRGSTTRRSDML